MDRLPGRLEDGPRLLGRLRRQPQLALRLRPALPDLPRRPLRLEALAARRQPRPRLPARLHRLPLLLQPGRHRGLGAAAVSAARLPPLPGALDRLPRQGGGDPAGLADGLAADRGALPDGGAGGAEHGRRGDDRRRLRGDRRRRQDRPRRTDLRQLPGRHPLRRHLRADQLPGLRAVRADLALQRRMGRPARRPRRLGRLRPAHLRLPDPARAAGRGRDRRASGWR